MKAKVKATLLDVLGTGICVGAPLIPVGLNGEMFTSSDGGTTLSAVAVLAFVIGLPALMLLFRNVKFKFNALAVYGGIAAIGFIMMSVAQMFMWVGIAGSAGAGVQQIMMSISDGIVKKDEQDKFAAKVAEKSAAIPLGGEAEK